MKGEVLFIFSCISVLLKLLLLLWAHIQLKKMGYKNGIITILKTKA